jgi:hypothetical protein
MTALRATYSVFANRVPRIGSIVADPTWLWGAGSCHPAMTSPPAGVTYAVTVDTQDGSSISDTETGFATVHVTILGGKAYFFQDLCYWPFGSTILFDRDIVQNFIADSFFSQTSIAVTVSCPNPLYGKVNQTISCLATRVGFTTKYWIDMTITSNTGTFLWRLKN